MIVAPLMRVARSYGWKVEYVQTDEADWPPIRRGWPPARIRSPAFGCRPWRLDVVDTLDRRTKSVARGSSGYLWELRRKHVRLYIDEQVVDTGAYSGGVLFQKLSDC